VFVQSERREVLFLFVARLSRNFTLRGFPIAEKTRFSFSGLITFLKQRVDSAETVQGNCWQCFHARVGVKTHQTKNPSVAIITANPRTEPAPPSIC
jgi:hypothetical protein